MVREWTGVVAEHYYALAERAIRAADPDALFLGDRLPIYYDPAAVRAMAPHVDAIAINYNVDSSDGWIADYFFDGLAQIIGRQARARHRMVFRRARKPHREPQQRPSDDGRDPGGTGARRGSGNQKFRGDPRDCRRSIGFSTTTIRRAGGPTARITISGWSISTDRPYEQLVSALAAANRGAPDIHADGGGGAAADRHLRAPHAAISVDDHSLVGLAEASELAAAA